MEQVWMNTVRVLAGGGGAAPGAWPASRTRRVELWDQQVPQEGRQAELGAPERALVRQLLAQDRGAGELAYRLGMGLEEVNDLLSGLRASGIVTRRGMSWQCTYAGRAALCALPEANPIKEVATC